MSSIMRRRKGVMCGSFASERGVEVTNPFMMPQRGREEAESADRGGGTPPDQRGRRGEERRGVEEGWTEVLRPSVAERELVLAHREAV